MPVLPAIFFLSGCSALIFENLWFYQAGITFGNSVWASSLVLAGFMGGLALGNALAARLRPGRFRAIRMYALLELAIAISGFALVIALPLLTSALANVLGPLLASPWIANPLRLGFAFALLLIPSTAMGATLPVMVSALYRHDPNFGSVLGRLYGWNTLGAFLGALAGDLVLIEALGVRGTALSAAGISTSVAVLALALSKRVESSPETTEPEPAEPRERLSNQAWLLLLAAGIAGLTLLGLEVAWFRFLLHFVHASSRAFAILLATVLAGIGLGGLLGGYLASSVDRSLRLLPGTAVFTGLTCLVLYWFHPAGPRQNDWFAPLVNGLSLMFPVALLSGVLFTLLGAALKKQIDGETRAAGLLTLANTTGATVGPLLVGFFLLPKFGVDRSVQVLSGLYLVMGLVTLAAGARPDRTPARVFAASSAIALVVALLVFPVGATLERHLRPVLAPFTTDIGAEMVEMREGVTETVVYTEFKAFGEPVWYQMLTNGYSMSGTSIEGQRYMKLFVYLPIAMHPDMKSALLISYGVGNTGKALTDTRSLESIDVVDISRDVLDMNKIPFPAEGECPLEDPRVEVHVEDGRYFLEVTDKKFDLITGEPPPPKTAGIVSLYTREYFALAYDRLNEGGIISYWLPTHVLSPADSKSITRAFCDVFPDCTLWGGAALDWILVGTRDASGPPSSEGFIRQWSDPVVGPDLAAIGVERPAQLSALFMGGPTDLAKWVGDTPPLTDDFPKRLSDDVFDLAARVTEYVPWMKDAEALTRFNESPWIDENWPRDFQDIDPAYFVAQWELNRKLIERSQPLQVALPKVHIFLTLTEISTVPLWMLDSHELRQRAARTALEKGSAGADALYELGLGALAQRSYWGANDFFTKAAEAGAAGSRFQTLRAYARFMALGPSARVEFLENLTTSASSMGVEPWLPAFLKQLPTGR